jgi:hypothetical protein
LFGISPSRPGKSRGTAGQFDVGVDKDRSSLIFAGPQGDAYYFLFEKLDRKYYGADIPKFTKEEATTFARKYKDKNITPDLTFASDYWEETQDYVLVPIEEGKFKIWTSGRIACVGDSVHKMSKFYVRHMASKLMRI